MRKSETANGFRSMAKKHGMTTQELDRLIVTETAGIVGGPNCNLCVRPSSKQTRSIQSPPNAVLSSKHLVALLSSQQ